MERREFLLQSIAAFSGLTLPPLVGLRNSSARYQAGSLSGHSFPGPRSVRELSADPASGRSQTGVAGNAAILGGGVCGLAAATELAREGWKVDVFEKQPQFGGFCSTLVIDGFQFDLGPHVFRSSILGMAPFRAGDLDPVSASESFLLKGKILSFPKDLLLEGFLLDTLYTLAGNTVGSGPSKTADFEQLARYAYGEQATREIFKPLIEKWCSTPLNRLDARYMASRLHAKVEPKTVLHFLKKYFREFSGSLFSEDTTGRTGTSSPKDSTIPGIPAASHYAGRIGARIVPERLALSSSNITIRCDRPVAGLGVENGRVQWVDAGGIRSKPDFVISTIPVNQLADVIKGDNLLAPLKGVHYLNVVFVYVRVARPSLLKSKWTWIIDPKIPFYRMSEMKVLDKRHAPEGSTGLCLEAAVKDNDPLWERPDDYWIDPAKQFMARTFSVKSGEILGINVVKRAAAYPNFSRDNTARISQCLESPYEAGRRFHHFRTGIENLALAGRAGSYVYLLTPGALSSGVRAAKYAIEFMAKKTGYARS